MCLVCREQIAMFKDHNFSHGHYETKHLNDAERVRTSRALLA